ncbi:MAG TPA: FeoB-associated Cys-rich membrane protein [Flammeovirgaceae bacterium]|nr:FeoB-associated Cys-rich membrane protein [Flammeovirgaceae bacterium]
MMQEILVWVIFAAAVIWLGWKFFGPKKKTNCGPDCKCE